MPGDPHILAGAVPSVADLRALGSWTLILSGTQSVGHATLSQMTSMAVVQNTGDIAYTLSNGAVTLTEERLFHVSIVGVFPTSNTTGTQRFVGLDGSVHGRRLSQALPPVGVAGWGQQPSASLAIPLEAGETLSVYARHDGNANLNVTVWLSISLLPS